MVGGLVHRRIPCSPISPVLVYTDACGDGHIGVAVFLGGFAYVAHTHVPKWMRAFKIGELEMPGALFGLCVATELATGRPILICCDNACAKWTIVRGNSRNAFSRGMAAIFWAVAAHSNARVWVEFPPLNP